MKANLYFAPLSPAKLGNRDEKALQISELIGRTLKMRPESERLKASSVRQSESQRERGERTAAAAYRRTSGRQSIR
jgi:hypothetical protein